VFSEKEAIMRAYQIELIYSQSSMLYEIFPYVSWSTLNKAKKKYEPHANGIPGLEKRTSMDLSNQLQQLLIQRTVASQTLISFFPPT
jgi:hypothetical protein